MAIHLQPASRKPVEVLRLSDISPEDEKQEHAQAGDTRADWVVKRVGYVPLEHKVSRPRQSVRDGNGCHDDFDGAERHGKRNGSE